MLFLFLNKTKEYQIKTTTQNNVRNTGSQKLEYGGNNSSEHGIYEKIANMSEWGVEGSNQVAGGRINQWSSTEHELVISRGMPLLKSDYYACD